MGRSSLPAPTVALVIKRDGGVCLLRLTDGCMRFATVADHRANRQAGGAKNRVLDQPSNLVAACVICNGHKESLPVRSLLVDKGLRVVSGRTHRHTAQKALETPVQYPDGWYLLCDLGHRHPLLPDGSYEECPEWEEAA